ncbi:PWWP domain [Trypanosoma vivax]|nr:hypothetical protein TRVL_06241 [Trypanosoma vivax]KAH8617352.1 PWWP domain [Trypanosoma vivax]
MAPVFGLNTLVWLKQEGYPWWPGVVVDPSSVEIELPTGYDTCILCMPLASSSLAVANSSNSGEIRSFIPSTDTVLIEEAQQDADCALAVKDALKIYEQQQQQLLLQEDDEGGLVLEEGDAIKNETTIERADTGERGGGRRHKTKRYHSEDDGRGNGQQGAKERDGRPRAKHNRKRRREEERSQTRSEDSDDNDEDYDCMFDEPKDRGAARKRSRRDVAGELRGREYSEGSRTDPEAGEAAPRSDDGVVHFKRLLRERRVLAQDHVLEGIREELISLFQQCTRAGVEEMGKDMEMRLLDALSPLTGLDVTLEQLLHSKIGVAVGEFLSDNYPLRVVTLASAILHYWFHQLPEKARNQLVTNTSLVATQGCGR